MKIQVPINGISTSPVYKDGDTISLVNLRNKAGALEPIPPRKITKTLSDTYDLVFVHQLPSTGENWIGVKGNSVYLDTGTKTYLCSVSSLTSITQIGNVLNLIDSTGIKHLFWYDNEYKLISTVFDGTQEDIALPAGKIELRTNATYDPPTVYLADSAISGSSSEETVAEVIKGLFAKAISVERKRGYLKGFVLACTAYELFDGSVILHSNPVLIGQPVDAGTRYNFKPSVAVNNYDYINNPATFYDAYPVGIHLKNVGSLEQAYVLDDERSYLLETGQINDGSGTPTSYFYKSGINARAFMYPNPTGSAGDKYWSYVSGADPSLPSYQEAYEDYPAGTKFNWFSEGRDLEIYRYIVERKALRSTPIPHPNLVGYFDAYGTEKYPAVISRRSEFQVKIEKNIPTTLIPLVRSINVYITPEVLMYKNENYKRVSRAGVHNIDNYLPDLKSDEEIKEELMSQENFYKVKEIFPNDIVPGEWVTIDLKDKLGDSLLNQEELPQDPLSHHQVIPNKQYTYNSRLHIADYKRILSRGWPLPYLKQTGGLGQFELGGENVITGYDEALVYALVEIKTETGVSKVVRYKLPIRLDVFNLMPLLSYPDKRAKKITLRREYKGWPPVTERGVCWATHTNPTVGDSKLIIGSGSGMFDDSLTGLTKSTTYYVRAYATNAIDTYYGSEYSFTTADGQERITLGTPSDLTYVSVKIPIHVEEGSGALQSPVGGVCWNTTGNPTTADNTLQVFDDYGSFEAEITGLTPGTTYYFRGYATTEIGTTYTSQIEIETPTGILEVETLAIDPFKKGDTWAWVRGTVNDPTESGVIEYGICYSLTKPKTPTVENDVVAGDGLPELFEVCITDLIPNMGIYYARAYAANLSGVYYGSVKTFWTKHSI